MEFSFVRDSLLVKGQDLATPASGVFPSSLENSGYVILSAVLMVFAVTFFMFFFRLWKTVAVTQKNNVLLTDMVLSLYLQQQALEYKMLLDDLNYTEDPVQKTNARTHIYNYLNKIAREICETKDKRLAAQLATAFFSRIYSRYIKLSPLPEGILYFKYVGSILHESNESQVEEKEVLDYIRNNYKKEIMAKKEITKEQTMPEVLDPKKKKK